MGWTEEMAGCTWQCLNWSEMAGRTWQCLTQTCNQHHPTENAAPKTKWCPNCRQLTRTDTIPKQYGNGRTIPAREFCSRCGYYLTPPEGNT